MTMDSYVIGILLTLFLVSVLLLAFKLHHGNGKPRKDGPKLPPGPWQLPVIGSLHHLLWHNPRLIHRALAAVARRCDAPIMYLRLGELPVVVVSSAGAAEEVMRTHDAAFSSRAMSLTIRATIGDRVGIGFLPYGERWRQLRKMCTVELLGAKPVLSLRSVREEEAGRLAAMIGASSRGGEPVNMSRVIADHVADSVLRSVLGERFRWRDEFLEALDKAVKKTSGFSAGDLFPSSWLACTVDSTVRELTALNKKMFEMVDRAIDQHRERKAGAGAGARQGDSDCLMDALLRIQKEGDSSSHLPMATIRAVILDMFAAGSDTTSVTLQWTMSELMKNPRVMQKAQAEMRLALKGKSKLSEEDLVSLKYLKHVIKETLRLHPAVPLLVPRECQDPCNIFGYDVPKGTMVFVNAWAIGRDPNHWDDAEEFKPERFEGSTVDFKGTDYEFIPFGAGRRMCPGITFTQANMEIALAMLLYHFDWQLPSGVTPETFDMEEELGMTVGRKRDLYLCPIIHVTP